MANVTVQARVTPKLKREAEAVLSELGLSTADAIRVFLHQVVNTHGLPFRPTVKHQTTLSTIPIVDQQDADSFPAVSDDEHPARLQQFKAEVAAFDRQLPELLNKYEGFFVAVHQGKVIASGQDKLALAQEVRDRYGNVVCYIERVIPDAPRKVRMTSMWAVRK